MRRQEEDFIEEDNNNDEEDECDDFVQNLSSGDDEEDAIMDELEKKMELSYKQRIEELSNANSGSGVLGLQRSRPESSSTNGGCRGSSLGVGIARLRSAQMRPSDLKPLNPQSLNNPYSFASNNQSNPNILAGINEDEKNDAVIFTQNSISVLPPVNEEMDIYSRLVKYIQEKSITRDQLCKPMHLYLNMEELYQSF